MQETAVRFAICDDDKVFLNKLEIRIRGLCQKHKIAVKMECYVSAKEMLEGIKNLDEISVFFIDIDIPLLKITLYPFFFIFNNLFSFVI